MNEQEWREGLQPGDEVIVNGNMVTRLGKVARLTQQHILVSFGGSETKFRKSNGHQVSSDIWHITWISPATAAAKEKIALVALRHKATRMKDAIEIPSTRPELEALISALEPFTDNRRGE